MGGYLKYDVRHFQDEGAPIYHGQSSVPWFKGMESLTHPPDLNTQISRINDLQDLKPAGPAFSPIKSCFIQDMFKNYDKSNIVLFIIV